MLPDLSDVLATLRVVALPLRERFRGITVRHAALFQGPEGWTEFSPFLEYDDAEAATWLSGSLAFGWTPTPVTSRSRIGVNATLPAVSPNDVAAVLSRFPGCQTVKVKVAQAGQTLGDDVARVSAVRNLVGSAVKIRIDANGSWSVTEALVALEALSPFDLEYAEQPCATVEELAQVRAGAAGLGIPIAADESIRRAGDPERVTKLAAADIAIVKAQPLGGIDSALHTVHSVGLSAVASSALETSVGVAMGAFLAAALPESRDAGLGTVALLAADVTRNPLLPEQGAIDVRRVEPAPDLLDTHAARQDEFIWWRERITRCHRILTERQERGSTQPL